MEKNNEYDKSQEKQLDYLVKLWKKPSVQIAVDICRFLLVVIAIVILIVLIRDIEAVKILGSNPCLVCMNKTGATCISLVP